MTMTRAAIVDIVAGWQSAQVRYLLVGGLAVIAHGLVRLTTDIDVVLDLEPHAARKALEVLDRLGYRPRAPVAIGDFADVHQRHSWQRDKDMVVFSLWHPQEVAEIDLFLAAPFDFEAAWNDALWAEIAPGQPAAFVDYHRLLAMKQSAGRPKDLEDIELLELLHRDGAS